MSNASDFIIENGVLTKYVGPGGDVVIPEGVTSIGYGAFYDCSSLTSVMIPEGVITIAHEAFFGCRKLTSVVIPEGVASIDYKAFRGCGALTSVVIPDSVTTIGSEAFYGCRKLTSVVIPDGVTSISYGAFFDCRKLTSVTLPANCGRFVDWAFKYSDLLRFHIDDLSLMPAKYRINAALCFAEDGGSREDPRFESHGKYLKTNAGKLIPIAVKNPALLALLCREKWITAKYMEAFQSAVQETGDAELIAMLLDYENNKLTAKDKEKVEKQKQKQEDTVFDRAVARMDQKGIAGLNFVVTGDVRTFNDRDALKSFIESKGGKLQSAMSSKTDYLIANDAKTNSVKRQKAAGLGIEIITEYQFNEKAGRTFQIEKGKLNKYNGAGGTVVIPENVTAIGDGAFSYCGALTSVVIPEGVTAIGDYAFSRCGALTSVVIPEGVTSIGNYAFCDCSALTSVVIPEGVISIGDYAFYDCSALASIAIPDSVASVGDGIFSGCSGLADENGFVIYQDVLCGYYGANNVVHIPERVRSIDSMAFFGCRKLTNVEIPEGIAAIGTSAFNDCTNLTNIAIPESVTSISDSAFHRCSSLTSIEIPESVTSIGDEAFYRCSSLTSIEIPEGVTSIGYGAFYDCSSLTSVVIPEGVTSIGYSAFYRCSSLTIHGAADSFAETYAKENNIPFVAE